MVIVGAGFGGLYAARALKRAHVRVTVVDRRNHHLFQPLLYQVATAALSPGDIAYPVRAILRGQRNARVLLGEVSGVDLAAREVLLFDGRLPYDYLILAAGSNYNYLGHDNWKPRAPGLKTLEDALEIRRRILLAFERAERTLDETARRALLTFVIIGGGPTGVELAGAIAEIAREVMVQDFRAIDPREARIVVVEAGPRILTAFPEDLARKAEAGLRDMGVEIWTNSPVTAVEEAAVTAAGQRIPAGAVMWAAGVEASPLAKALGVPLDRAGRILVEPDCSVAGHPEVFVIGDMAALNDPATGRPLPGVAPVAIQQGRCVAKGIAGEIEGRPRRPFRYKNRGNLATVGRAAAIADFGWLKLSGFVAWLVWLVVHVLWLIGFRNRVVVMLDWAWAYISFHRSARLITGDIDFRGFTGHASTMDAGNKRDIA